MNLWFLTIGVLLCLSKCHCQWYKVGANVICDGIPTAIYDNNVETELNVTFTLVGSQNFDPARKTVLIVHGFAIEYQWAFDMANQWLTWEPVNAIVVGWPSSFLRLQYLESALRSRPVAVKIKEYIFELFERYGSQLNPTFHFVGHSLGAHIVGQAGRLLKREGVFVHRVTALDPASLCFETTEYIDDNFNYENYTSLYRIRKSDARFVDVIHTNSALEFYEGNLGIYEAIGDVDFYMNGGNKQPQCQKENCANIIECAMHCGRKFVGTISKFFNNFINMGYELVFQPRVDMHFVLKNVLETTSNCDHGTAIHYFTDSLDRNKTKIWANPTSWPLEVNNDLQCQNRRCSDKTCIEVGINAEFYKNYTGAFYADTGYDSIVCDGVLNKREKPKFSILMDDFKFKLF